MFVYVLLFVLLAQKEIACMIACNVMYRFHLTRLVQVSAHSENIYESRSLDIFCKDFVLFACYLTNAHRIV